MYRNKEEMKERQKTVLHVYLLYIFADIQYSFCVLSSLPCFCTFSRPSLLEMKFCRNFSPSTHVDVASRRTIIFTKFDFE